MEAMGSRIVLVPGFWLGGWAWEAVADELERRGHRATALTLPGLESPGTDRSSITLGDHVDAVVRAVGAGDDEERTVLVAHSGAGPVAYAASDRAPERIDRLVYVDSGPLPDGAAVRPDLDPAVVELPLPGWAQLEAEGSSLAGLDEAALQRFRSRAVPHPAGPARQPLALHDDRRYEVPTTVICSSFPAATIRELAAEGHPVASELSRLPVEYVDLPTGHWPMWSRTLDLARAIDAAARA
jgi:pimeloyl-ACP methyl ester carboxylesterase